MLASDVCVFLGTGGCGCPGTNAQLMQYQCLYQSVCERGGEGSKVLFFLPPAALHLLSL